jgi:hypothetical protein
MQSILNYACWLFLALIFFNNGNAQVNFRFIPELYGNSVTGLLKADVQNCSPGYLTGIFRITVRNQAGSVLLTETSGPVRVAPGTMVLQSFNAGFTVRFGASVSGNVLAQTGYFAEGNYEYCFEFSNAAEKPAAQDRVFENCFSFAVPGMLPLELLDPQDGSQSCLRRPLFSWQPQVPIVISYRYNLLVCRMEDNQTADEAMLYNVPVVDKRQLAGHTLLYPPELPDLLAGNSYAWKITVMNGPDVITRSDTWQFRIDCSATKKDSVTDSYRQLSELLNGNFYRVADTLKFSLNNPYNTTGLKYSITDVADAARPINNLPVLSAATGLNKMNIPLEDIRGLRNNSTNLLKIYNIGDRPLYLQFLYNRNDP